MSEGCTNESGNELDLDVIDLPGGLPDVAKLEAQVTSLLYPDMDAHMQECWDERTPLIPYLRPLGHHGMIANLRAIVIPDAGVRLLHAAKLGLRFQRSGAADLREPRLTLKINDPSRVIGFRLVGDVASSSKPGVVAPYSAEIYYRPVAGMRYYGEIPIARYVTYPQTDEVAIQALRENSQRMGIMALKLAYRNTVLTPMQD